MNNNPCREVPCEYFHNEYYYDEPITYRDSYREAPWKHFYDGCYYDEPIIDRDSKKMPEQLRLARSIKKTSSREDLSWQQLFLKQAIFLADYEDDYEYDKEVDRHCLTYQHLSDRELRAYFSWRTKWRKGDLQKGSFCFALIYVYELLHLVSCANAQEAYDKLQAFARDYADFCPDIMSYLDKWFVDFVVYYGLDPKLLADKREIQKDNALFVLLELQTRTNDEVFRAVLELSGSVLAKSRFYKKHPKMMAEIVVNILRQIAMYYTQQ